MDKKFVTTSAAPRIILDIGGDLTLKGQDLFEVIAKSDNPNELIFESQDDQVNIRYQGDCNVRVPRAASVQVTAVHGDGMIKAVDGEITIDTIHGDLELRNVGTTRISSVMVTLKPRIWKET
jgi:hypothetical protein